MSKFNERLFEKRARDFKSSYVGKNVTLKEKIEKLPTQLKDLWTKRKFHQFLEVFANIISNAPQDTIADYIRDVITPVLTLVPEFGYSYDEKVHELVYICYVEWNLCGHLTYRSTKLRQRLERSFNIYVVNILQCTERMKLFFDDDLKKLLKSTSAKLVDAIEEQTLEVTKEMRLQFQNQRSSPVAGASGYECVLWQVLEFMEKVCIYPLDSEFPAHFGVYCIYHVGETQLYEGRQISPSAREPVYVGMSRRSIANRLKDHCKIVAQGKTAAGNPLKLSDFVVGFILVNVKDDAPSIERMLIEYFSPVWNREAMRFCFGNASSDTSNWYKFHIQNEEETVENMLEKLRIRPKSLESIHTIQ